MRWWRRAISDTAARVAERHQPQLIYVTLLPNEGLAPALALGRRLGIPVVADLRDPWGLDETRIYASALHRRLSLAAMHRQLRRADLVVMNTPEACEVARRTFAGIPAQRIQHLTNGYDEYDFGTRHLREMLQRTKLGVGDVGKRVGIGDSSNFSRLFRKFEGMSPREYRRRFQGKQP